MIGQVKKLIDPNGRGDLMGRFGAWWDGRDYVAPELTLTIEAAPPKENVDTGAPPRARPQTKSEIRVKALQLAWGADRFGPGSVDLDGRLLDTVFETMERSGGVGFIGADPALLNMCRGRTERPVFAAEWRAGCLDAERELTQGVLLSGADIDRPLTLPDNKLEGLISLDAFAYADHKAGLAGRAYKTLSGTGRWAALDITRTTPRTPAEAFASAWAEPQLVTADEIDAMLWATGFVAVKRENMTEQVIKAARAQLARMGEALDTAVKAGLDGREGALMLQELAWDVQSWRARLRALEGGALAVHLWTADKDPARKAAAVVAALDTDDAVPATGPADEGAVKSLFE
jgi:hypothetical protein